MSGVKEKVVQISQFEDDSRETLIKVMSCGILVAVFLGSVFITFFGQGSQFILPM